jgi:hypothetical protein
MAAARRPGTRTCAGESAPRAVRDADAKDLTHGNSCQPLRTMAVGFHLTFRLRDSRVIAPDVRARRRIARSFIEIGDRYGLLAFRLAGDHGHAEVVCDRAAAGRAAQAIGSSITQALGLPDGFNVTHIKPIVDQAHLERTFHYVLGQHARHGLTDDAVHDGSALPDLLRYRILGTGIEERVRAYLPKVSREELRRYLGIAPTDLAFAPAHLADAAAAVFALPGLGGREPAQVLARAAAARIALTHMKADAVTALLGLSKSRVHGARDVDVPENVILAVHKGMTLRASLGDRLLRELPAAPQRRSPRAVALLEHPAG